jgi:hypothetical protein
MHGQQNIKFCIVKQTKQIYKYKNNKIKLYKNNAAIWYNTTCRMKQRTPDYISKNFLLAGTADSHSPECVTPDDVLIQFGPPDDELLLLETCGGMK